MVTAMINRTSTGSTPWTLAEAGDRRFARLRAIEALVKRFQEEL
jgi:AMP-polyphosphate phosphotransferase